METTLQIRLDEKLKDDAEQIYKSLGMSLQSAVKMFLHRSIMSNGVPFEMTLTKKSLKAANAKKILRDLQQQAEDNGLCDMTLQEINAEISAARAERKARIAEGVR